MLRRLAKLHFLISETSRLAITPNLQSTYGRPLATCYVSSSCLLRAPFCYLVRALLQPTAHLLTPLATCCLHALLPPTTHTLLKLATVPPPTTCYSPCCNLLHTLLQPIAYASMDMRYASRTHMHTHMIMHIYTHKHTHAFKR